MSVRRVSNWGGNIIGSFPTLKSKDPAPYESTIERDLLFFLEYDHTVLTYTMQPFTINGIGPDECPHSYTPDILVTRTTGKELVECKPAALLDTPHAQQQIALGESWAYDNDCTFVVVTDEDLRAGSSLANLKLLWRYARLAVPHPVTERCRVALKVYPSGISFETLLTYLDGTSPSLTLAPCLYSLIFQHILAIDLNKPLTPASLVWLVAK